MNDLIHITPEPQFKIDCPNCRKVATSKELLFQGMHVLTKWNCQNCNSIFYSTLPLGHDLLFPCVFDLQGKLFNTTKEANGWLIDPLVTSLTRIENQTVVQIEKDIKEQKEEAIILNCLDNCFGHVFYKLWNLPLLKSKYPDKSIIVFIPKKMKWLLPAHFSEAWLFDASFQTLGDYLTNLDQEIKQNLLPRFKNVSLSKAYTHLSLDKIHLNDFLKTDRFDLSKFNEAAPQITFALREDRVWHRYPFEYFLFKVFVKLHLPKRIFIWRQNYLVGKVAIHIKKNIPTASLTAVGLGASGNLSSAIDDQRKKNLTEPDEKNWCSIYSSSHVVVGIHGSNMLIPTALAAGFVELLPREKIKHISEDTLINRNSRYSIFLGRHVDHFSSPKLIAHHIVQMISVFPYLYKNTEQE